MSHFKWIVVAGLLYAGLATACGGDDGSGVSGSKTLVSLSDSEAMDVCDYAVDVAGAADRTVDCGGGATVHIGPGSVSVCVMGIQAIKTVSPSCTATVDNFESCAEAFASATDAEVCSDSLPTACEAQFACIGVAVAPWR